MELKRVYGRKYKLVFDERDQCWHVLEWRRSGGPPLQGMLIMTLTEEAILSKLFNEEN